MLYGVEIWGWREREGMERMQERYLGWVMGMEWKTSEYMLRKEITKEKTKG